MAEKAYPFTNNGTGDGTSGGYTAAEWRKIHRYLFGDGVANEGNKLAVTGTASPLAVNTGHGVVDGLFYENSASVNLNVSTPSVGLTGGHVILRADYSAQTVRLVAVRNTDGVSAIPSLTQTSETTYEIRLATFTITTGGVITLTDARTFLHMYTLVARASLDNGAALSVIGRASNSSGAVADIAASSNEQVLMRTGNALVWQQVATAQVANDAIDDTKAGNRVPQFYRRQGNSASDWAAAGTSSQTPAAVRMQAGVRAITFSAGTSASATVTFPQAFSNNPIVLLSSMDDNGAFRISLAATVLSSSQFAISAIADSSMSETIEVAWLAIGPE